MGRLAHQTELIHDKLKRKSPSRRTGGRSSKISSLFEVPYIRPKLPFLPLARPTIVPHGSVNKTQAASILPRRWCVVPNVRHLNQNISYRPVSPLRLRA